MPIPLYGFLSGDTLGLLIFAEERDTADVLAGKLARAASVRVAPRGTERLCVRYKGVILEPKQTVAGAGIEALDRFDVIDREP